MASIIAHNIISPLGFSSEENYGAVLSGEAAIAVYSGDGMLRPYSASLFTDAQNLQLHIDGFSRYESLSINSIKRALDNAPLIDVTSPRVGLILSTTKGSIEQISDYNNDDDVLPSVSAQRISDYIGFVATPITVCNACISGVSALILGQRLLSDGVFDYVVVCGCDVQSKFIISGFQALNAVSPTGCRPFDIERNGLSLGEAAATVVLGHDNGHSEGWRIVAGSIRNDAFHVTTPSPKGEGCRNALASIVEESNQDIAFINAHGTATMYNDQMESKAIEGASLSDIPVNALKGVYGHTMGAAGILETIVSMIAAEEGVILGTCGYSDVGVSGKININTKNSTTGKKSFVKIISGFGGCNGALLLSKYNETGLKGNTECKYRTLGNVIITPESVVLNGTLLETTGVGKDLLKELYTKYISEYPKFHKMDMLCKVGLVAAELLLSNRKAEALPSDTSRGVILFNRSSSINTDREYYSTICDNDNYFPSPSEFIYTLPNIVLSEIAIKHKIKGETSLYILPCKDEVIINHITASSFGDKETEEIITGWIDCYDSENFYAEMKILRKN